MDDGQTIEWPQIRRDVLSQAPGWVGGRGNEKMGELLNWNQSLNLSTIRCMCRANQKENTMLLRGRTNIRIQSSIVKSPQIVQSHANERPSLHCFSADDENLD